MKIRPLLDLIASGVVLGNHSIWLPQEGIKVPFQWGGHALKRTHREEATTPIWDSLADELAILRALADRGMAPPIGELVYFEVLRAPSPFGGGALHDDPCGAFGYEMADARKLPPGRFDVAAAKRLPITGSRPAWSDATKRENIVNGYLVDVRRTVSDRLRWTGEVRPESVAPPLRDQSTGEILYREQLVVKMHKDAQFPQGARPQAYQDFWIGGELVTAERRVEPRAKLLGFVPKPGETVLDIGTQAGGMVQYAAQLVGAAAGGRLAGVDVDPRFVDCARLLARSSGHNICFRQFDVVKGRAEFLAWTQGYYPKGIDHLLLLSMEKHLGHDKMFELVDALKARRTYIETNAVAEDSGEGPEPKGSMKLWTEWVVPRRGKHVGNSRDRNLRRLYLIEQ